MASSFLWSSATLHIRHSSLVAATAAVAAVAGISSWHSACQTATESPTNDTAAPAAPVRVEVHLMDKIQQKEYLTNARDAIPSTLRILAIDLPEMRTNAFSGDCRLSHDKIFVEDVAMPKVVDVTMNSSDPPTQGGNGVEDSGQQRQRKSKQGPIKLKVAQKALVKSLVQCRSSQSQQHVGVELLEASIADLNKYKLRKTHQFGNFKYDPGKYYANDQTESIDANDESSSSDKLNEAIVKRSTFEDELEAPWNQYAWAEELKLRINGQVGFDAPLERASSWNRYLFGNAYKVTVQPVSHFWEWPLPTFAKSNPDGVDGRYRTNCRASNKPHAVIANGAALQRVPSSMRLLQKLCKKADVPLFVIHDPRVWGGNTHQSLPEALKDMRRTIKNQVIGRALEQQGSTAFSRGRMLGQVETEAKWQVKEQKRRSKEMFSGRENRGHKSDIDWSKMDSIRLERRLVQRGVIKEKIASDGEGSSVVQKFYSDALVELARRCVHDIEEQHLQEQDKPSASPPSSNDTLPGSSRNTSSSNDTTNNKIGSI